MCFVFELGLVGGLLMSYGCFLHEFLMDLGVAAAMIAVMWGACIFETVTNCNGLILALWRHWLCLTGYIWA